MHYWEGQDEPIPDAAPVETGGTVCLLVVVSVTSLICVLLACVW